MRLFATLLVLLTLGTSTLLSRQPFSAQIQQALQVLGLWPYSVYADGQVPVWDAATSQFVPGDGGGGSLPLWTGSAAGNLSTNIAGQAIGTVAWAASTGTLTSTSLDIFALEDTSTATRFDGVHVKLLLSPTGVVTGDKVALNSNIQVDSAFALGTVQGTRTTVYKTGAGAASWLNGARTDVVVVNGDATDVEGQYIQVVTQEGADAIASMAGVTALVQVGGSSPVVSALRGFNYTVQLGSGSAANVPLLTGGLMQAFNKGGSGSITDLIAAWYVFGNSATSGGVTTAYGSRVSYTGTGSAPTTTYGIYIDDGLAGATQWAFYNADTDAPVFTASSFALGAGASYTLASAAFTNTAPSSPVACTSPTITWSNGSAAWQVDVGTSCTGVSTLTVTLPAAANAHACRADSRSHAATMQPAPTAWGASTITITNFSRTAGLAVDWADGADVIVACVAG